MKLQQLIRRYKNQTHQTNEQLAKQFHVSENTVSRWLRGEVTSLQEETAYNVSAVLGFDVSAMLKGKAITLKQPVLGHVKAGYDLFLESDYLGEESVSDEEYQQGDFFLRISGNSMVMDGISDGSLVYVRRCDCVENGAIAVVAIGEEVTIKHFWKEQDRIILKAANPDVADRVFTAQEAQQLPVSVLGRVLFCKRYF